MIELNWTLLMQFANFVVLLLVLNYLFYRPLRRLMQDRQQAMEGSYQRARDLEGQISEKMADYQQRLQEAKLKGNQEREGLRRDALIEEGRQLGEARQQAAEQVQAIRNRVAAEASEAREALQTETQVLATQVAGQVLGRKI